MIKSYREQFNQAFTEERYQKFLKKLEEGYPEIPFRVAETPIFIPNDLKEKLIRAGDEIVSLIKREDFKKLTEQSIPSEWKVPNENAHPHFLTFDFGLTQSDDGIINPMLIEMQGFPSLYAFQSHLAKAYKEAYQLEENLTPFFNGLEEDYYWEKLKKVILGKHQPYEVVLMDVDAKSQKTAIDFWVTEKHLGIKVLSVEEIHQKGNKLFYYTGDAEIEIKRIYNRLIFDEIAQNVQVFKNGFDPRQDLDVEWVTHPNWFYRISKYTMPFLQSDFVPETFFLNQLKILPNDLENYVLKPLFSFAGMGVIIDVKPEDIENIKDPENWILQKKVTYAPVIQSPTGGVKAEIRLLYLWADGDENPELVLNLARLSRGKMIGVRYNKDFDWVGGTVGLMA